MENPRIVFMGTPEFGCAILQELLEEGRNVVGVVCQPDKLVGRRQVLTFPPAKNTAVNAGIEVIQPIKIRTDYQAVLDLEPDLIVTCAYGQIIPMALLDYPKLGCINVHTSLLPALRGGAPIQHAIIDGYDVTGVTVMEMSPKMDAGAIIAQRECPIDINDTYGSLHDKLIVIARELFRDTIDSVIDQSYTPIPQAEEKVTYAWNISKEEEKIDFTRGYMGVYNQIRGLIPAPCAYFLVEGKKVKIWGVELSEMTSERETGSLFYHENKLALVVDNRVMLINSLQLEGRQKMGVREFRNGAGRNWEGKRAE
ncbi:MAG: methionyl-tRNA formyltransferase [Erysipelotrichaceae bacterium]|nr:methionyl-tRNA formyltransferase [Erysipelotrichaceae bacterium]